MYLYVFALFGFFIFKNHTINNLLVHIYHWSGNEIFKFLLPILFMCLIFMSVSFIYRFNPIISVHYVGKVPSLSWMTSTFDWSRSMTIMFTGLRTLIEL